MATVTSPLSHPLHRFAPQGLSYWRVLHTNEQTLERTECRVWARSSKAAADIAERDLGRGPASTINLSARQARAALSS
ncbi:hypothetical protein [Caldimonas tepidiphila]|uniref:hypothetical protein n=1 Tax=Caldimonas tepidiphila TaxID=2315841 RepID=UPI000E5A4767|nr:hypothetical protein [Caldimonas tepidiphila]